MPNKPLVISAPSQGIASSPHVGFGDMRNLDIFSVPGVAKLNNILANASTTAVTALIKWIVRDPVTTTKCYAVDSSGDVYVGTLADGAWTFADVTTQPSDGGAGQGLAIWENYLFCPRATAMDIYGPLSGTPAWVNSWSGITLDTDSTWHPMLVSDLDGELYGGAGRDVFNIAAGTSTTFTVTIASPAVFSATAHGLAADNIITFKTTGALPTGLTVDTFYYVIATDLTANAFKVSATSGGAAVNTSGSQSGAHTFRTITGTARALSARLPDNIKIKCLAEQGNNLMIGTWKGTNIDDFKFANIYPWDGSATTYGNPIILTENGVNAMINIGGYLYILAGIDGKIYKSNGAQAWVIGQIPLSVADTSNGKYIEPYPGAIENFKGRLFFGMSASATNDLELRDGVGVYSLLETSKGNVLNFEHSISTETMGSANPTVIGALLAVSRDKLLVGFRDNATYQIDSTNTASYAYATDYTKAYFDSPLYQISTYLNKRQFTELEFQLAKELAASEGIQIRFKVNLTDDWTTIGTYTTTNIGTGVTSFHTAVNIPACEQIQIKVGLKGTSTTTPEFKNLMLN